MAVYACSDLHGQLHLFEEIKSYLKPKDTIYFLGDAIDRGDNGWQICKEILDDPRFIYIKGNHEDMMLKAIYNIKEFKEDTFVWSSDMDLWFYNGGEVTYNAIIEDKDFYPYFQRIKCLPSLIIYYNKIGNIFLSHAGLDPGIDFIHSSPKEENLLWDRSHYIDDCFYGNKFEYVIHGHTPNPYLVKEINYHKDKNNKYTYHYGDGAFWYAGGHKCCIDCGAHYTNTTVLLNLDTFEEIKIGTPNQEDNDF